MLIQKTMLERQKLDFKSNLLILTAIIRILTDCAYWKYNSLPVLKDKLLFNFITMIVSLIFII